MMPILFFTIFEI